MKKILIIAWFFILLYFIPVFAFAQNSFVGADTKVFHDSLVGTIDTTFKDYKLQNARGHIFYFIKKDSIRDSGGKDDRIIIDYAWLVNPDSVGTALGVQVLSDTNGTEDWTSLEDSLQSYAWQYYRITADADNLQIPQWIRIREIVSDANAAATRRVDKKSGIFGQ